MKLCFPNPLLPYVTRNVTYKFIRSLRDEHVICMYLFLSLNNFTYIKAIFVIFFVNLLLLLDLYHRIAIIKSMVLCQILNCNTSPFGDNHNTKKKTCLLMYKLPCHNLGKLFSCIYSSVLIYLIYYFVCSIISKTPS